MASKEKTTKCIDNRDRNYGSKFANQFWWFSSSSVQSSVRLDALLACVGVCWRKMKSSPSRRYSLEYTQQDKEAERKSERQRSAELCIDEKSLNRAHYPWWLPLRCFYNLMILEPCGKYPTNTNIHTHTHTRCEIVELLGSSE